MIPDIGLMIGFYIILRALSFVTRGGDRVEHWVVKLLSGITILVTILCLLDLLIRPTSPPK